MAVQRDPSRNTDRDLRRWLDEWRVRGEALDQERLDRLRALDEPEAARIACQLLWPMARTGAGDSADGLLRIKDALRLLATNA
jgi:hypothetical protein